jgi:hypothetical protein
MDHARNQRWNLGSFALARFEKFMVSIAQKLGRLDCQLLAEDARNMALPHGDRETEEEIFQFNDQLTMSYLWVLGAYELVRSLDQRARANPPCLAAEIREMITRVKHQFNRLRVPLAKMEPSSAFRESDYEIAYPALVRDHGIGWFVAPEICITRRELADEMINLLEELRRVDPSFSANAS